MNIVWRAIGKQGNKPFETINWPEGWPIPQPGHSVSTENGAEWVVSKAVFYPHGEFGDTDPFVYILLNDA